MYAHGIETELVRALFRGLRFLCDRCYCLRLREARQTPRKSCNKQKLRLADRSMEQSKKRYYYNDPGTHRAMEMKIDWRATCMPGHTRRPNPKGIVKSLSTLPFQFPAGLCMVKNREGSNVSGSSNRFVPLARALWDDDVRQHGTWLKKSKRTQCYRIWLHLLGYNIHHTYRFWLLHVVCLAEL